MMVRHMNQVQHNPPLSYGDCHRVCFATILGLQPEEVPHFYETPETDGEKLITGFLADLGLKQAHVLYQGESVLADILHATKHMMPGVPAILGGFSRTGCGHSVVILDGEIFCDPTGSGIVGPMDDGFYWVTLFVAKPNFARRAVA